VVNRGQPAAWISAVGFNRNRQLPVALTKKRQHELEQAQVSRFFGPGQLPSSQKDPWVINSGLGVIVTRVGTGPVVTGFYRSVSSG